MHDNVKLTNSCYITKMYIVTYRSASLPAAVATQYSDALSLVILRLYHISFFSRSYLYTIWSVIDIIMSSVCPSQDRLSVTLCIVALGVGVQG